jgi:glycosyltransferase involved in cell wall biosynthesis
MRPRVLFISGREVDYMRNRVLLTALGLHFDVTVCTSGAGSTVGRTAAGLVRLLASRPDYDICFAGFYGQPLAIALSLIQRRPILLDAYVSTYDTLCKDRRWIRPGSLLCRLAQWLDRKSCLVAASVVTDTETHARYFAETFGIPADKLHPVYVGCDETLFQPREEVPDDQGYVEVFFYGSFLPLHGTEVIVKAADLLRHRADIRFTIGGEGMCHANVQQMVAELSLSHLDLVGWVPLEQLPYHIARGTICLGGHFSTVPKAARVISTKTFQFIAMQKPTIVGDSPATRELFAHGEQVWAVSMGDPEALAEAIQTLADDSELRRRLATGGYELFQQRLTTRAIADRLEPMIREMVCTSAS